MVEPFKNPYLVPQAKLEQDSHNSKPGELASVGQRIGARCIDFGFWFALCFGPIIVLSLVIGFAFYNFYAGSTSNTWAPELADHISTAYLSGPSATPASPQPFSWTLLYRLNFNNPCAYFCLILGQVVFLILHVYLLEKRGQNIGKRMLDIAIVDRDTLEKPNFGTLYPKRYLLFELLAIIGYGLIFLFRVVDLLMLYRDDRRTIHDIVANTIVVKL